MNAIDFVHEQLTTKPTLPTFKAGDNITVNYKIVEGTKERISEYRGDVLRVSGHGDKKRFTVRKMSGNIGKVIIDASTKLDYYFEPKISNALNENYKLNDFNKIDLLEFEVINDFDFIANKYGNFDFSVRFKDNDYNFKVKFEDSKKQ